MVERITSSPIQPEVQATRRWIEQEIGGRGICPPLVRLLQNHRNENGSVDWDRLSRKVDIDCYTHLNPYEPDLLRRVSDSYLRFITEATQGEGPLTKIFILPDFESNSDYDKFVNDMKQTVLARLVLSQDGPAIARSAFQQYAEIKNVPLATINSILNSGKPGEIEAAKIVIKGTFGPVYFYGEKVTNEDVSGFSDTKGPRDRYKILSRAPFYMIQISNAIGGRDLIGNLDRKRLRARNTRLASETSMVDYESKMREFRSDAIE